MARAVGPPRVPLQNAALEHRACTIMVAIMANYHIYVFVVANVLGSSSDGRPNFFPRQARGSPFFCALELSILLVLVLLPFSFGSLVQPSILASQVAWD